LLLVVVLEMMPDFPVNLSLDVAYAV